MNSSTVVVEILHILPSTVLSTAAAGVLQEPELKRDLNEIIEIMTFYHLVQSAYCRTNMKKLQLNIDSVEILV